MSIKAPKRQKARQPLVEIKRVRTVFGFCIRKRPHTDDHLDRFLLLYLLYHVLIKIVSSPFLLRYYSVQVNKGHLSKSSESCGSPELIADSSV